MKSTECIIPMAHMSWRNDNILYMCNACTHIYMILFHFICVFHHCVASISQNDLVHCLLMLMRYVTSLTRIMLDNYTIISYIQRERVDALLCSHYLRMHLLMARTVSTENWLPCHNIVSARYHHQHATNFCILFIVISFHFIKIHLNLNSVHSSNQLELNACTV